MNKFAFLALAATLALAACSDEQDQVSVESDAPASTEEPSTEREAGEALDALGEAGRQTGEATSSAVRDLQDAAGPALDRAHEAGEDASESIQEGLNNLTRGAACQTSRAAEDAEGIAANC